MAMNTTMIETPRGRFNVRQGGAEGGIPVVMIHGWPESSHCWEAVASHLDGRFRVIAPDLRGLGDSERTMDPEAYHKPELAKDVASVLDALGVDDFFLVGHDWGGVVAQELALLLPERVKRLVILNIHIITNPRGTLEARKIIFGMGGIHFWYQYFQMQPYLPEAMIKGNEKTWVSFFFGKAGQDGTIPAASIAEYIRCYSIENTPATAASYYRIMGKDNKHWDSLADSKLPMPSLYIHGTNDPVIIPAFLNHIEDAFESVRLETLEAGHFVQEERPAEVAAFMDDFFKENA